jgi:hypothetical protein
VLANDYDDPLDSFMTPGISDFQQTTRRIELCVLRARIGEGGAVASITGSVDNCQSFECFTYYTNCHSVSVEALGEPVSTPLTALKNEDLRKKRILKMKCTADGGFAHLPSMDVPIDIFLVDVVRGAENA